MGMFDDFASLRESNKLEYKSAAGGFPNDFWETYSAFANTDGGTVVLGAKENKDGLPVPSGMKKPDLLVKALWDGLNNRKKTSANILTNADVTTDELAGQPIVIVHVPRANREVRPVFINGDMFSGSYRRNGEGDYHCTRREITAMVRDSFPSESDKRVLDGIDTDALSAETIRAYRQVFDIERPDHPWARLDNETFLVRLGAVGRSDKDGRLHPTHAGLLMFGEDWRITDEYPEYFLDCRQVAGGERWDNRIVSSSGDWSGNVYDFYCKAYNMLAEDLPRPFRLDRDMRRIDDTPQHKAVREALVNSLIHADYYDRCGVVAIRYEDRVEIRNPGCLRMSAQEVVAGGMSDARNGTLMKMFNLIGIGEKAGSGFDVMRQGTRSVGKPDPTIEERQEPDIVTLVLPLETHVMGRVNRQENTGRTPLITSSDQQNTGEVLAKSGEKRRSSGEVMAKTEENHRSYGEVELSVGQSSIIGYLQDNGPSRTSEIAKAIGRGTTQTNEMLRGLLAMGLLTVSGATRSRRYQLAQKEAE